MKLIIILGIFFGVTLAQAQTPAQVPCQDRMTTLRGERYGFQQIGKSTYNAAAKALAHFREIVKTEPVMKNYIAYFKVSTGTITGYRYILGARDRSSEKEITYYYDSKKKLVYAKQTPAPEAAFWFCEPSATSQSDRLR